MRPWSRRRRARGLSEVDAALEAIRGMQRLGLYPKPSTLVATRAMRRDAWRAGVHDLGRGVSRRSLQRHPRGHRSSRRRDREGRRVHRFTATSTRAGRSTSISPTGRTPSSSSRPMAHSGAWSWTTGERADSRSGARRGRIAPDGAPEGAAAAGRVRRAVRARDLRRARRPPECRPSSWSRAPSWSTRWRLCCRGSGWSSIRDPDRGQLSSLLAGLETLGAPRRRAGHAGRSSARFQPATVASLLAAWHRDARAAGAPRYQGVMATP